MKVPGIPFIQGRNRYGTSTKYAIAVHCTANTAPARNEAEYAARRTDGVSAHFFIDDREVIQSLDTNDIAGHAGSTQGNTYAIAVEFTGLATWSRAKWMSSIAWEKTAEVFAAVSRHHNIPPVRVTVAEMKANPRVRGAYDHNQMRQAWGGTDHVDPGPNFPWDHLLTVWKQRLEEDDMPTVREFWLGGAADLIQRYDENGKEITTGNTHMTTGFALGWAVREATLTKVAVGKLDKKVDAIAAAIEALAARDVSDTTGALVAELRRVGDDLSRQLANVTSEIASLRTALVSSSGSSVAASTQD
ncbi:MAG TPA: peptidoglycan recognition family protein [Micromonospora sp.]